LHNHHQYLQLIAPRLVSGEFISNPLFLLYNYRTNYQKIISITKGHTEMKNITLAQAIAGYLINLSARHLSQNTVNDYTNTLNKFSTHVSGELLVSDIGIDHINRFLAGQTTLSNKTLSNYHSTLSTFFEWLVTSRLTSENPVKYVQRAKPEKRVIDPVPESEIKALLEAVTYSKTYGRRGKKTCRNKLPWADKNVAIIMESEFQNSATCKSRTWT